MIKAVIPGRAKREPGIHGHDVGIWIPGLRKVAHPGTTEKIRLELSKQQQDQQDNDDQAKTAAAVIAGAVERPAADAAKAAEQGDNENDKNDRSN